MFGVCQEPKAYAANGVDAKPHCAKIEHPNLTPISCNQRRYDESYQIGYAERETILEKKKEK